MGICMRVSLDTLPLLGRNVSFFIFDPPLGFITFP